MRNCPDGFVVAEARNETTVDDLDDLEDASFMLMLPLCLVGAWPISNYSAYPT
jgi:hypothetical protein